ncbi:unnamed protein product [Rhodiola kirilowii]
MSMKQDADHWAFLEDFEAPMWVDLVLEAKVSNKELDDEWFHRSHKFHQLPSRKLKEAFKHIDSGGKLEIDNVGSSSLKIPSSVSESRGKCYVNHKSAVDFRLSLSGKECLTGDANREASELQCGNDTLHRSAHGDSKPNLYIDRENGNGSGAGFKLGYTSTVPDTNNSSSSNHLELNTGASDPKSSITSENSQMVGPEVAVAFNHIIGRRSQLLSVMKQSLRKSCAIRMATRGQIIDVRQTNGLRSSSGKSSVESCSIHSHDTKNINVAGTQRASRTPESKNVERLSQESKTKDKVKTSIDGAGRYTNNTSDCGSTEDPRKSNVKPGSSYPCRTKNIDSSRVSTSSKTKAINRASECGNRGKVGNLKVLKSASATKPAQCVNNNGGISQVIKSATVKTVPGHSTNRQKLGVPMGTMARIYNKDSVSIAVGKSVVARSSQPQVMTSKALHVHRRPLAPLNHKDQASHSHRRPLAPLNHKDQASHRRPLAPLNNKDQASHRRPLAPEDQMNQESSTFARKAKNKGKTDDGTKFISHGKENVGKLVPSIKNGNGRGVVDKSNRMKAH